MAVMPKSRQTCPFCGAFLRSSAYGTTSRHLFTSPLLYNTTNPESHEVGF